MRCNALDTNACAVTSTVAAMRRRGQRSDYGERSWWTTDHGGLTGWGIVVAVAIIAGIGVFVVVLLLNPR